MRAYACTMYIYSMYIHIQIRKNTFIIIMNHSFHWHYNAKPKIFHIAKKNHLNGIRFLFCFVPLLRKLNGAEKSIRISQNKIDLRLRQIRWYVLRPKIH